MPFYISKRDVLRRAVRLSAAILCLFPALGQTHPRKRHRLPPDFTAWAHVARCESGGWQVLGSSYPDPIGVTAHNWAWAGGRPLPPGPLSFRQRLYVVRVADRFIGMLHVGIPDKFGCAAW
jgi:hypothetical protein